MRNERSKKSQIAAISVLSAVICALCMCFLINDPPNYASAENAVFTGAFSANAEISEPLSHKGNITFDDSVWGRLANAIKSGIEAWQG